MISLRGKLRDIFELSAWFSTVAPGEFKAVFLDAKYRALPLGTTENDNAAEARFYNHVDAYAEKMAAAFFNVHHSSKGEQGDKRVTDVGSGGGAQSRAVDCHLILREHIDKNVVVLDAGVRSFAPVEPLALRWIFPMWMATDDVDPGKLKGRMTARESRQLARDDEGMDLILDALAARPLTTRKIRGETGLSKDRCQRLLDLLTSKEKVDATECNVAGHASREYFLMSKPGLVDDRPTNRPTNRP